MRITSIVIERYISKDKNTYVSIINFYYSKLFGLIKIPNKKKITIKELDTGYYLKPEIHFDNFNEWLNNECELFSIERLREGVDF